MVQKLFELLLTPLGWLWRWHERRTLPEVVLCDGGEIRLDQPYGKVIVTRPIVGLCYMQVCAEISATDEEILQVCNSENPSGTELGWNSVIRSGDGAPLVCADDPDRLHILVAC